MKRLLLVEDNAGLREQMKWALADCCEVVEADSALSCAEQFDQHNPGVICLDMGLDNIPDKGLELIDTLLKRNRLVKIIVITANTRENLGAESIKRGAIDFLNKPVDIEQLRILIDRAFRLLGLEQDSLPLHVESAMASNSDFFMVGCSPAIQRVFEYIRRLAQTDVNVLITGESGTGKELCARAIHYHSARKNSNFVPINCGAIPENLIESELFGYVRGAFTGANADKVGLIESAHGGTLLLDEVGEMPQHLQVRLLRFLEDQKVQRLGDTELRTVNVRVIAATNQKVQSDGNSATLRSDLYYRLSEFQIDLPPLRERSGDVLLIAADIIERNRTKFGLPKLHLSTRAEQVLKTYSWPGNVRELENKLSRASIICMNQTVEPEDLQLSVASSGTISFKDARSMFEKEYVVNLLRKAKFNISEAAKTAGLSRPTLYDLMKKHDIQLETETKVACRS